MYSPLTHWRLKRLSYSKLRKAYDTVYRKLRIPRATSLLTFHRKKNTIRNIHDYTKVQLVFNGKLSYPHEVQSSIRQGCYLASLLLTLATDVLPWTVQFDMKGVGSSVRQLGARH